MNRIYRDPHHIYRDQKICWSIPQKNNFCPRLRRNDITNIDKTALVLMPRFLVFRETSFLISRFFFSDFFINCLVF